MAFEFSRADKALGFELDKALEIGSRLRGLRLGRSQAGTGRFLAQLQVLRIELGQYLPPGHGLPQLDEPTVDLAAHAKAQTRLGAGADLGRKLALQHPAGFSQDQGPHRPHRRLGHRLLAAAGQQGGHQRQENVVRGLGPAHCVHVVSQRRRRGAIVTDPRVSNVENSVCTCQLSN